jgi:hypothetical protein
MANFCKTLVRLLLMGIAGSSSLAKPVFDGEVGFELSGNNRYISLNCERITAKGSLVPSGTLKVSLWATEEPFDGGKLQGTRIASFKIRGLVPGQSVEKLSQDLPTTLPIVAGDYYMTMTLEEYFSEGYRITDWFIFEEQHYIKGGSSRKSAPIISMEGPYNWELIEERRGFRISTGPIKSSRDGSTGSLKIIAWLTKQPYEGGAMQGFVAGHVQLEPLGNGMMYPNTDFLVRYQEPPRGRYYVTFTISEWDGEGYVIMDHYTFENWAEF